MKNLCYTLANYQLDKLSLSVSQVLDCVFKSPYFLFQVERDEAFLQLLEHFPTATLFTLNVWKLCAKHHIFKYWNENSGGQNIQFCPWDICQIPANQSSLFWCIAIGKFVSPCAFEHSSLTTLKSEKSQLQGTFWGNCSAQVFGSRTNCKVHNSFRKVSFCNQKESFEVFTWKLLYWKLLHYLCRWRGTVCFDLQQKQIPWQSKKICKDQVNASELIDFLQKPLNSQNKNIQKVFLGNAQSSQGRRR